ncbi:MAG TPA: sugar porter family MFS transporter [Verrucomicrobiae bacterium]|nr:sugar porter family MFS transporter [Verrucomicrobiae bacterium]
MTPNSSTASQPPSGFSGNMAYIILISLVAAFGGFLFGYDVAVVSGAIGFLSKHFHLSAELSGWAASSLLVGCTVGAMVGGSVGDRFGRRPSLVACALLFAISAVFSAIPQSSAAFAWARFAGGIAIGAASMLSPLYIAEVAPEKFRGRLVGLYQLAIVVGILIVFFVNLQIQRQGDETWNLQSGWRWMFASLTIPALLFGVLLMFVPESPRWLLKSGRRDDAERVLVRMGGAENARLEIARIDSALREETGHWKELFTTGYFRALMIGTLLAIFSQVSGINAIMYFAPEIFKTAGAGTDSAFRQTVIVGVVNLVFTFVALWLVDKAGRKPLLLVGTVAQIVALTFVGAMFHQGKSGMLLLGGILLFVAAFAMSTGPVTWILNSEIFPTKLRARAMSVAVVCLWMADWVVTQTFPMLTKSVGSASTFWVYAGCSFLCVIYIITLMPETKGRTLEEIEAGWKRK